jgi:hypothetical protein
MGILRGAMQKTSLCSSAAGIAFTHTVFGSLLTSALKIATPGLVRPTTTWRGSLCTGEYQPHLLLHHAIYMGERSASLYFCTI